MNEPESYRIIGEGKGGAAGFAKGGADVVLEEVDAGNTKLIYKADAQVGGKLAQLGSRLIQGTAKKYADDFFANLTARIAPQEAEPAETTGMGATTGDAGAPEEGETVAATPTAPSSHAANQSDGKPVKTWMWWAGGAVLIILIILLLSGGGG